MKKTIMLLFLLLAVFLVISCEDNLNAESNDGQLESTVPQETYVYITATGTKYHKSTCYTIKNSNSIEKISLTLAKAEGYAACGICF